MDNNPTDEFILSKPYYDKQGSLTHKQAYKLVKTLGNGGYGSVISAVNIETQEEVVVKLIKNEMFASSYDKCQTDQGASFSFINETSLLRYLADIPHIVQIKDCFTTEARFGVSPLCHLPNGINAINYGCIVLEKMDMSLDEFVVEHVKNYPGIPFHEQDLKCIMYQLLLGLNDCHIRNIVHFDIKPPNILLNTANFYFVLADFGLSKRISISGFKNEHTNNPPPIGTIGFRPPEVHLRASKYGHCVDMWSMGCVLAYMAKREKLFTETHSFEQFKQMVNILKIPNEKELRKLDDIGKLRGSHDFVLQQMKMLDRPLRETFLESELGDLGLDLLQGMLQLDPRERINVKDALAHPWFYSLFEFIQEQEPVYEFTEMKECLDEVENMSSQQ